MQNLPYEVAKNCLSLEDRAHHDDVMRRVSTFDRHSSRLSRIVEQYCSQDSYSDMASVGIARRKLSKMENFLGKYLGAVDEARQFKEQDWFKTYKRTLNRADELSDLLENAKSTANHVGKRLEAYGVDNLSKTKDHPNVQLDWMIIYLNPLVEEGVNLVNGFPWNYKGFFGMRKARKILKKLNVAMNNCADEYEELGADSLAERYRDYAVEDDIKVRKEAASLILKLFDRSLPASG
jgi:hypothetical protein